MTNNTDHLIECDPDVMFNKACIKGTRITVERIVQLKLCGMTHDEIISEFPSLDESKIEAAIKFSRCNVENCQREKHTINYCSEHSKYS